MSFIFMELWSEKLATVDHGRFWSLLVDGPLLPARCPIQPFIKTEELNVAKVERPIFHDFFFFLSIQSRPIRDPCKSTADLDFNASRARNSTLQEEEAYKGM